MSVDEEMCAVCERRYTGEHSCIVIVYLPNGKGSVNYHSLGGQGHSIGVDVAPHSEVLEFVYRSSPLAERHEERADRYSETIRNAHLALNRCEVRIEALQATVLNLLERVQNLEAK